MALTSKASADATLSRLRLIVLALVGAGLIGTAVELALLAHDEDAIQIIPFVAIGAAVGALVWRLIQPRRVATRAVQITMCALIVVGLTGVVLHYRANMEFQLELDKSLGGWPLMMKVLEAKAPPALAPANMALLGLVGLAGLYRETSGG
jgi:hypothetical protein